MSHCHQLWPWTFDLHDCSFPSAGLKSCPPGLASIAVMCFCCSSLLSFLSFFLLPTYSFFIPAFFSFFFHLTGQLFLNYMLNHVNISFCRKVTFVNVTGFLVCKYYCHNSFGQCIHVSTIFHLPLNFTQNMFCWSETLNVKPGWWDTPVLRHL
jgi:hypothetical protein